MSKPIAMAARGMTQARIKEELDKIIELANCANDRLGDPGKWQGVFSDIDALAQRANELGMITEIKKG